MGSNGRFFERGVGGERAVDRAERVAIGSRRRQRLYRPPPAPAILHDDRLLERF
jgi:hypothetical protein